MADEILRSKHAFGNTSGLQAALDAGKIDHYDILFMKDDNDKPVIGWIDRDGNPVIVTDEKADLTELESDVAALETEMANKASTEDVTELSNQMSTKADAEEVNSKIGEIETALDDVANASHTHEKIKYEIEDVPVGTLIKYLSNEIRIMCPENVVWTKQSVGSNGDPNCYYATFKTYAPSDDVVGYIEHLGGQVDAEILKDLKTDKYGRKYQPTWLGIAKYDEATGEWSYYGANSSEERYIGWDYQIDWFNADDVMVASDSVRINLSNENCHNTNEPYYTNNVIKTANAYTDAQIEEKIAEILAAYEIVEF